MRGRLRSAVARGQYLRDMWGKVCQVTVSDNIPGDGEVSSAAIGFYAGAVRSESDKMLAISDSMSAIAAGA
jgi:hypothetical protein